jgi:hypothetical protein
VIIQLTFMIIYDTNWSSFFFFAQRTFAEGITLTELNAGERHQG